MGFTSRNWFPPVLAMALLVVAGCGDGETALSGEGVEEIESPIQSGTVVAQDYSGHVALEVWAVTLNNYTNFCSGILMANGVALTAKHCFPVVVGRQVYVRMGGQRKAVTAVVEHPTLDLAVIRFTPMMMWNWWFDHYTGGPPVIPRLSNSSYRRKVYEGTNLSLNGTNLTCFGYGRSSVGMPLTKATFPAIFNVGADGPLLRIPNVAGQQVELGDSGMGCGPNSSSFGAPVAFITSVIQPDRFAWGPGAESFRSWFGY